MSTSQTRQVGAQDEIEITPEMIEAGLKVYRSTLHPNSGKEPDDDLKVIKIFHAMLLAG